MGTNYYWIADVCEHCQRVEEKLHIGKSSCGWVFALRVYPDRGINSLYDWMKVWFAAQKPGKIENEYGEVVTRDAMLQCIVARSHPQGLCRSSDHGHDRDVRQGEGTWDYCNYEFS